MAWCWSPAVPFPPPAPAGAIFSVGVAPAREGQTLARFAAGELKAARVVVLADSRDATATALAGGFVKEFPRDKDTRVDEWSYKNEAELTELAERVKKANPQAVLLAGTAADLARLRSRLADKSSVHLLFGGDAENLTALPADREAGEGVYLATPYVADAGVPQGQEFAKKYQERCHEPPDLYAALAYDGARLLFEAMRRAKSTPTGKAREELPKIDNFDSLTGPLAVNSDDHYARRPVFVVRLQDGRAMLAKRYDPDKPADAR